MYFSPILTVWKARFNNKVITVGQHWIAIVVNSNLSRLIQLESACKSDGRFDLSLKLAKKGLVFSSLENTKNWNPTLFRLYHEMRDGI